MGKSVRSREGRERQGGDRGRSLLEGLRLTNGGAMENMIRLK